MSPNPAYILSPTDVRNIRNYVQDKYAAMPGEKRAEIVADAVQRIIHKQLPDFELPLKRKLTGILIRSTVLEQQRPVSADDIYRLCMELDGSDEHIAAPLEAWLRRQEELLDAAEGQWPALEVADKAVYAVGTLSAASRHLVVQRRKRLYVYGFMFGLLATVSMLYGWSMDTISQPNELSSSTPVVQVVPEMNVAQGLASSLNELPDELRYSTVNRERLLAFLESKSSLLAEAPYFEAIMMTAEQFDIHPALLFAITGQEQAFVPRAHERAEEIVNNPFNVFYSWQQFNTTTKESAEIAARTINRLSKDRPHGVDAIVWINREYAEDPAWSRGVRSIFAAIMARLNSDSADRTAP